ncbi:hypothetical protein OsJ_13962 [Oryza sativa Japonica Group]|nr:hypothetical protein OsJ_13962 [Oryza sativa Japonica Group]
MESSTAQLIYGSVDHWRLHDGGVAVVERWTSNIKVEEQRDMPLGSMAIAWWMIDGSCLDKQCRGEWCLLIIKSYNGIRHMGAHRTNFSSKGVIMICLVVRGAEGSWVKALEGALHPVWSEGGLPFLSFLAPPANFVGKGSLCYNVSER